MTFCRSTAATVLAVASVFALSLSAVPAAAQKITMKFGTATPRGDQNNWMQRFKERMEARAPGKLDVKIFPANQLGSIHRQIEGMQLGTVEGWIGPPSFLTGVDPRFQVVDAPGLFENWEHAYKAVSDSSFRKEYLSLGAGKGIQSLGIYCSNIISVVSRKPIQRVDDIRGLKIRVLGSEMEIENIRRLGAAGVPMDLSEALPAVQRGAVDGVRSGIVVFVPFKYWNINKTLTITGESYIFSGAYVSKKWFDALPQELRTIMLEEAKKQDAENHLHSLKQDATFRTIWKKNGGNIVEFEGAEKKKLMDLVRPTGAAVVERNPSMKATYEKLLAAVKETTK